jgi:hypothetical protein
MGVWAILDGARDPAIRLALIESRLEFRCLYSGRLPRELEIVAPHLVELLPGHRLTHTLLDQGWGRSWGVLLKIQDPSNLRHHLRKMLKVDGLGARPMLFRYYDPRVLRAFLPQASALQLRDFFGPVAAWYAEDALGGMTEYRLERQQRLQMRTVLAAALRTPSAVAQNA